MVETNGHATRTPSSHLGSRELLENPEALQKRLHREFKDFARPAGPSGELVLDYEALANLTDWLAMELSVDRSIFGEMSQMFWRFDFTGDKLLREPEATQLMLCMMRSYRDATRPPPPGSIRLGGNIQYKCVHDEFTFEEKIGEGGQGTVFLCRGHGGISSWLAGGSKQVVLKMFDKSNPSAPIEDITREFELLMEVRHPLIAHVFEIFQDASNVYVVQEPYLGGDLSAAVQRASESGVRVTERWLAQIVQQVLTGVAFLHKSTVMHCDLKEPNVMIPRNTDWSAPQIVVIDFGLANKFATRSRPGGTPGYMPPEVWESGLWTPRGDVFSIGVLLFSMRTGRQPFTEGCRSIEEVRAKTQLCVPTMEEGSQELKNLVLAMTDKNFQSRPMIATVLQDPWFSMADDGSEPIDAKVLNTLRKRKKKTELKKAVLADLASRENLAQMKELNELFLQLDFNGDGVVSAEDVQKALTGRWAQSRIDELVQALLGGKEGEVSYEEFMGQLIAAKEPVENELLWRVFTEVDKHRKGYLDKDDIRALLERPAVAKVLGGREPESLLKQMSRDGTGRVTFDDFKLALQGHTESCNDFGLGKLRRQFRFGPFSPQWQVEQAAEYYSVVHYRWLPCTVIAVDYGSGAVQVDIKPGGYWLHGIELWTRLRRPLDGDCWLSWLPPCMGSRSTCGR